MPFTAVPLGAMVTVTVSSAGSCGLMVAVMVVVPPASAMVADEGLEKVTVPPVGVVVVGGSSSSMVTVQVSFVPKVKLSGKVLPRETVTVSFILLPSSGAETIRMTAPWSAGKTNMLFSYGITVSEFSTLIRNVYEPLSPVTVRGMLTGSIGAGVIKMAVLAFVFSSVAVPVESLMETVCCVA